jgi:hypothetical protein
MEYAIELLKEETYKLQKSRDNLRDTAERIKMRLKESDVFKEDEELLTLYASDYETTDKKLSDQIDSLISAITYLSTRGGEDA